MYTRKPFTFKLQLHSKNPDLHMTKDEFRAEIKQAIQDNDSDKFAQVFSNYLGSIEQAIIREANNNIAINDSNILSTRGVRQLTSEETKFYQKAIEVMQAAPNSVSDLDVVIPETVIDAVFDDLKADHELLELIDFNNVTGLTRILLNTNIRQLAHWGPLNSEVKEELTSGFKEIVLGNNKLSAYMFVHQDMLDLGPIYLDRYVREVMYEALAFGLEFGMICGTGKEMPIGMTRNIAEDAAIVGGEYPEKEAIKINSLDPIEYGKILSKMTKTEKGYSRKITDLILIVNPTDYFKKIMPATTIRSASGTYVNNVLPYPTTIVQSTEIQEGKAIIGLGKEYFMGMGLVKDGKIEYSDEYKFLEDYRTYKVRFLGHGQAKSNNDFLLLDISDLEPAIQKVKIDTKNSDKPGE